MKSNSRTLMMDKYLVKTKRKHEITNEEDRKRVRTREEPLEKQAQISVTEKDKLPKADSEIVWRKLHGENLNCNYCRLLSKSEADSLLRECEETLTYNTGDLAKVNIFGRWLDIPRQQVYLYDVS